MNASVSRRPHFYCSVRFVVFHEMPKPCGVQDPLSFSSFSSKVKTSRSNWVMIIRGRMRVMWKTNAQGLRWLSLEWLEVTMAWWPERTPKTLNRICSPDPWEQHSATMSPIIICLCLSKQPAMWRTSTLSTGPASLSQEVVLPVANEPLGLPQT